MSRADKDGFGTRGGWWVMVQFPLLLLAYLIPGWTGTSTRGDFAAVQAYGGLALIAAGTLLVVAGVAALGRWLTPFPQPLPESPLRTGGAYALMRHPLYTGILLMACGWSLYNYSLAGLVFDAMLFVFFDRKAVREERWLVRKFPAYAAYVRRVKRFIPGIY